jgi:hypothetical protein
VTQRSHATRLLVALVLHTTHQTALNNAVRHCTGCADGLAPLFGFSAHMITQEFEENGAVATHPHTFLD